MATEFLGLQMVVTLHGNPPRRLKGTISAVEAGAGLTLSNGSFAPFTPFTPEHVFCVSDLVPC